MTPLLQAKGLRAGVRLHSTDLSMRAGELVALIGPNGSGKTSLLRALADVEGESDVLEIGGESLRAAPPARRPHLLGFLPASRELLWPISVTDAIALGLPSRDDRRVAEALGLLELSGLADRPVNLLSTGERSRVLLARALAPVPRLLLLDEPFSNLDPYWVLRTVEILRGFVSDHSSSALVALHDFQQLDLFDRVLLVSEGRVQMDAAPTAMLQSPELREIFKVERQSGRWKISPLRADRQSSR